MDTNTPGHATLAPTALIDSDHPAVVEFAAQAHGATARERAIELYYLVRDGFRYDPYRVDLSVPGLRASRVLECGYGWCVPKAALLAAAAHARRSLASCATMHINLVLAGSGSRFPNWPHRRLPRRPRPLP